MSTEKAKASDNITHNCVYHVVWCTQFKRAILTDGIKEHTGKILSDIALENDYILKELNIYADHVEMVIQLDPRVSIHSAVKALKATSASRIKAIHPELSKASSGIWNRKYMVSTEGQLTKEEIDDYVNEQKTRKEIRRRSLNV